MSGETKDQASSLDLALQAFAIRFEGDLDSCWEALWSATIPLLTAAPPEARRGVLCKCFQDAAEKIAAIIHNYFPVLLVLAKERPCQSQQAGPAFWTAVEIRQRVRNFLGIDADEYLKDKPTPSEDSWVIETMRRILYGARCLPGGWADEFRLPWWADHNHLFGYWICRDTFAGDSPFSPPSGDQSECISHADSLTWVSEREKEIRDRLERQIQNEILDAMIAAGVTGDTVLRPLAADDLQTSGNNQEDKALRERDHRRTGSSEKATLGRSRLLRRPVG